MVRLRRKRTARTGAEDTAPVEGELATTEEPTEEPAGAPTEQSTEPYDAAETYVEADPAGPDPDAAPVAEPDGADEADEAQTPDAAATSDEPAGDDDQPADVPDADLAADENPVVEPPRRGVRGSLIVSLVQAAHIKQAVLTALVVGAVAAISGRSAREVGVVTLTVLTGQAILGWHNDLADAARDRRQNIPNKPLADGRLEPGTVWYAIVVAALILVPLSVTTGITAGCVYLAAVAVGMLGNVLGRTGILSFWSWAVTFGAIPFYLSLGGWGGKAVGNPPETPIVVLAALLGIGVHFTRSVWGLVADHEEGWTYLPLRIALKVGATRLLALSTAYIAVIVVALAIVGAKVGLSR